MVPKLSSSDLKLVKKNFQNIYLAANDEKEKTLKLVPAIFGSRLYNIKSSLKGRWLSWIHTAIAHLFSKSFKNKKLLIALKKTSQAFSRLEKFRRSFHDVIYEDYINNRKKNLPARYSLKEIDVAKGEIKKFYFSTYPLSRLVKKGVNQKLQDCLKTYFDQSNTTPFYSPKTFKAVKGYLRIMAIEGMLSAPIPLHIFNGFKSDCLEIDENGLNDIKDFIKKLSVSNIQGRFQVKMFHSALKQIINFFKEKNLDLRIVEELLVKEGCIFLDEQDENLVQWRDSLKITKGLKQDEEFYYMDELQDKWEIVLGKRIGSTFKKNDLYHVYEIQQKDSLDLIEDKLLIIPPNKICIEFMEIMRLKTCFGLTTPDVLYIHPTGKYAIVKKLFLMAKDIEWKTEIFGELDNEDLRFAHPLRILMQFFVEEKNSPKDLTIDRLGFDKTLSLKTTKDFVPSGKIDYLTLEEMIYEIAHEDNLAIYQYIVEPLLISNFCKKRLNRFFKESIKAAFKNNPYPIGVLAEIRRVKDSKTVERGKALYKQAKKFKKEATNQILKLYTQIDPKKLRKLMGKYLLEIYDEGKTLGRFWDSVDVADLVEKVQKDPALFLNK